MTICAEQKRSEPRPSQVQLQRSRQLSFGQSMVQEYKVFPTGPSRDQAPGTDCSKHNPDWLGVWLNQHCFSRDSPPLLPCSFAVDLAPPSHREDTAMCQAVRGCDASATCEEAPECFFESSSGICR